MDIMAGLPEGPIRAVAADLPLVDHHVHGALRKSVPRGTFEAMLTEAPRGPSVGTVFESQVGISIRRWCAPLLDLDPFAEAEDYWLRRNELGEAEVNRRLLGATGTITYLVETGHLGHDVLSPQEMGTLTSATAREVVRLEATAEEALASGMSADTFVVDFPELLAQRCQDAVGTKSIMAYRAGFGIAADRPTANQVRSAVDTELTRSTPPALRITHPVLLRHLQWCAVDLGLPIQLHCGYGDPDLDLMSANPLLLTPWLRQVEPSGVPILLLHNYPYHREAGYLAQVFDNVYFDIGLGLNYSGAASRNLVAESLEIGPFRKQLFSSDAWGPAELHLLGTLWWRRGIASISDEWIRRQEWSATDAERILHLIGHENAERIYQL